MRSLRWILIASTAPTLAFAVLWLASPEFRGLAGKVVIAYQEGRLQDRVVAKLRFWRALLSEKVADPASDVDHWRIESAEERARLPLHRLIPAAPEEELAAANGWPTPASFRGWHRSHGGPTASRYSALKEIDRGNVARLTVAWTFRSGTGDENIQSNPVIAEGLMYVPTGGHDIVAVDAATGHEAWRFTPGPRFPAKRGMLWWPGDARAPRPRLFFPAGNGLWALDARTGEPVRAFGGDGEVGSGAEGKIAPAIVGDTLVHATVEPAVHGYDVISGERRWSVSLSDPDAPTRAAGLASAYQGGRPWGGMAADEPRGIVYVTTSNPAPVLVGVDRPGDNLHSISVIAIDARVGRILWSFQEIAHDLWDLDIGAPPLLTTIEREGRLVDVVVAVTKLGNTLLLDRVSGRPLFDFRLRRAPASTIPGERTAPYQPDLELPRPFARQVFSLEDVTDLGPANRASVLRQLEGANFGFFAPHALGIPTVFYGLHGGAQWPGASVDHTRGTLYVAASDVPSMATVVDVGPVVSEAGLPQGPGRAVYLQHCGQCHGADREGAAGPSLRWLGAKSTRTDVASAIRAGSQTMQPVTGIDEERMATLLDYLFERDHELQRLQGSGTRKPSYDFERTSYRKLVDQEGYPGTKPPWGTLTAIDLKSGGIRWQVPLGEYPELTKRGVPITGTENFGGPMATAGGLVFVSGTKDRMIRAFDSDDGALLWAHELPFVGSAPPSTYEIGGRQYVVVPATGGGTLRRYDPSVQVGDAFVAFALEPRP